MTSTSERFPHWPTDDVERLLTQATNDPGARPGFLRALLGGYLWVVPLPQSKFEVKDGVVQPGGTLALLHVESKDQGHAIAAFTSHQTATVSCQPDTPLLRMPVRDLFEMTRGATIALNPVGPFGKVFVPAEIADLLSGIAQVTDAAHERIALAGARVLIASPKHPPTRMMDELRAHFLAHPAVRRAHLGVAHFGGAPGAPHPIIGIDLDGALADFVPGMTDILTRGAREASGPIDVVDLNNPAIGEPLRRSTQPFYERA